MSQTYTGLEIVDGDYYFVVDPLTRSITSKQPQKNVLIQYDHNSERFTFEIPRFIEGRDLSMCNTVRVCYRNGRNTGVYTVDDVIQMPYVNDTLKCSWLISSNATSIVGSLSFMLKFSQVNENNEVEYAWSTKTYDGVQIVESIESTDIAGSEYLDVIEQMKTQIIDELTAYIDSKLPSTT